MIERPTAREHVAGANRCLNRCYGNRSVLALIDMLSQTPYTMPHYAFVILIVHNTFSLDRFDIRQWAYRWDGSVSRSTIQRPLNLIGVSDPGTLSTPASARAALRLADPDGIIWTLPSCAQLHRPPFRPGVHSCTTPIGRPPCHGAPE